MGSKLTDTEKKIVASVERNNAAAMEFLERVVNMNSGTMNFAGVKAVGDVFRQEFEAIGLETHWYDKSEVNRSGHLFAETQGSKGKRLLLIGHLDTVYPIDSPFQKMEPLEDGFWRAPGGEDMKGGDVIIVYALKSLQELQLLDDAQVIVAFTGDEESPGHPLEETRKDFIEAALRSDIALGFEGAENGDKAVISRRGSIRWRLTTQGRRAHSSGIFSEAVGAGAIMEASRILADFHQELRAEEFLTFNPSLILGGSTVNLEDSGVSGDAAGASNVVAETATVNGDLRTLTQEQKDRAIETMQAVVSRHLPGTSAQLVFEEGYPALPPSEGNEALLAKLNEVSRDLGLGELEPYNPLERGAADISFVADYVDCIDGLGAMGTGAHSLNEQINLATFHIQTKRAALLIYRLIQS